MNNNNVNFIKNIDNLGRIVIPMDIRRKLNINSGDVLSITCNDKNICLNKFSSLENNYKIIELLKYFIDIFNLNMILVNNENVIFSNVINNYIELDGNFKLKIKMGNNMKYLRNSIVFGDKKIDDIYNMIPIVTNDGIIGSLIVLGDESIKAYEMCLIIVKIISLELNIS